MGWADEIRTLKVRANADTPLDARTARALRRRGHRPVPHRAHVLRRRPHRRRARDDPGRRRSRPRARRSPRSLPMQRAGLRRALPHHGRACRSRSACSTRRCTSSCRTPTREMRRGGRGDRQDVASMRAQRAAQLHEVNPMLGHRGCRLGITYPEIYEMQARAIFEAAVEVGKETGETVEPEIMIPLVGTKARARHPEARPGRPGRRRGDEARPASTSTTCVGTMIELPRAALRADEIAETRRVLHLRHQRPDADDLRPLARRRRQLPRQPTRRAGILERDPFVTLDQDGVGELVRIAAERGRATRPDLKLGICGEHGGDPASIRFCHERRPRLRLLLALPRADRAPRGGAGGPQPNRPRVPRPRGPCVAATTAIAAC